MLKKIYWLVIIIFTGAFIACTAISNNKPIEVAKPLTEQQVNPYATVDKSPMDISYYPVNYPMQLMSANDSVALIARLIYSRPQKNGRTIFGNEPPPKNVQQYGAYWRLGANEASEIEFFKPVTIGGKKITKGRYIIYCIPLESKWTIVLNNNLFSFGLHQDISKDVFKFEIPTEKTNVNIEFFTMVFKQTPAGANLIIIWDNVKAVLPILF